MAFAELGEQLREIGRRLQRPFVVLALAALTIYAASGYIGQERAANQLAGEVADRQSQLDAAMQERDTLTAELAALHDPVHYGQYATLVGRHTLLLNRPDETLLLVTWLSGNGQPVPPRPTDWKVLLHAANIPTP